MDLLSMALLRLAPSAALLWLAAALVAQSHRDPLLSARGLRGLALALAAVGVWWPLYCATAGSPGDAYSPLWALSLLAIACSLPLVAGLAATGEDAWHSGRRIGAASVLLLLCALAIAAASSFASPWRTGIGAVVLAGALLALAAPVTTRDDGRKLQLAAVMAGATAMVFAPVPLRSAETLGLDPALWPTLALAAFGAALRVLLRERRTNARISARLPTHAVEPLEDPLTRLPTRSHFETQLATAVIRCDASHGKMALLFIDLDGFKPVNDTFGHSAGDRVLQDVGQRLKACVGGGDVVARVGGDEFLILLGAVTDQDGVAQHARQVVEALSQPIQIEDRPVAIGCSIGIAIYPDSGQHAKLIARADAAMYAAKRSGGSGFAFFAPSMEEDARERFDLLRDLRVALENKELELYYQPKVDAATGKVTAAEALLRWQHPTRGMVPPSVFIPVAERFGLIRAIGHWVIEDACRQARVWQDKGLRMRVAINLSAVQMRQDDIVARLAGSLARHRVDPALLTCEITESVAMEDTKATQDTFRELGAAGIHLSIDDFGTGYSSLSYLRKLPAEELKIDRSFVMDVEFSADARAVVDAVVKLAHALGLRVVAEGIENERQQRILTQIGCDELQGFLFAKPMTARALLLWALDDRKEEAHNFAASLFASTQGPHGGFARTAGMTRAFADTAKIPLDVERGAPLVH